jgi:hypothetical protein
MGCIYIPSQLMLKTLLFCTSKCWAAFIVYQGNIEMLCYVKFISHCCNMILPMVWSESILAAEIVQKIAVHCKKILIFCILRSKMYIHTRCCTRNYTKSRCSIYFTNSWNQTSYRFQLHVDTDASAPHFHTNTNIQSSTLAPRENFILQEKLLKW